jgi:hypothetical protein
MRVLQGIFLVALAIMLQAEMSRLFLVSADFLLVTILTLAFYLTLQELVAAVLFSAWIVQWSPRLEPELGLLIGIPLAAFLIVHRAPWQRWFSHLVLVLGSVAVFFLLIHGSGIFDWYAVFLRVLILDAFLALFLWQVLRWVYPAVAEPSWRR